MRDKLNDNPIAQIGLVALLVVVAAFMLMKPGGGGEEEAAAPTEATVSVAGTEASATATGAAPGEAVEGAVEGALEAVSADSAASAGASIPPPPIPVPVARAYEAGKTVVLLIVHDDGIDDRLVRGTVSRFDGHADVKLFVVPAKEIARYAAITLGVEVAQLPALVVMRPQALSEGTPQASIDYGFQTSAGVEQAVIDAGYRGPEETYYPE